MIYGRVCVYIIMYTRLLHLIYIKVIILLSFFLNFSLKSFAVSDNCCTFASAFALKHVFCAAVSVCSLNDLHRQRIVVQEASVAYVLFIWYICHHLGKRTV